MNLFKHFKNSKLFWFGFFIKIVAIIFLSPVIQDKWFLKFISFSINNFSFDPWSDFYISGKDPMSYPYGPIMLILQLPLSFFGEFLDSLNFASQAKNYFLSISFKLNILIADICILIILANLFKEKISKIITFYWLSPIVLYISYWHGQVDIFPTSLLIFSLYLLKEKSFYFSAIVLGLTIACKLSMILAIPFICFYLLFNNRYHKIIWKFILTLVLTLVITQGPFVNTLGFQEMIINNPAFDNVFKFNFLLFKDFNLYIAPILYLILIFSSYKIGRMNFNLLYSFLGIAFFIILIFTPAEIGWYLWVVPFLVAFQANTESKFFKYGILLFSIIFVFNKLLIDEGSIVHFFKMDYYYLNKDLSSILLIGLEKLSIDLVINSSLAILSITGLILAFLMVKKNIFGNEFFKLVYKPILIAISGNSAAGKDTMGNAIAGVFGENSVASLSGDDYHLFERNSKKWEKITHLNPKANNLKQFEKDCVSLKEGKSIFCREYDHELGKFTFKKKIKKKDFLLIMGLHALYCKKVRNVTDISIFLDVNEELRKYFKINRDLKKRNYKKVDIIKEINRRKKDSKLFIEKQKKYADVVFRIDPINKETIRKKSNNHWIDTKIKLFIKKRINKNLFKKLVSKIFRNFKYNKKKDYIMVELNSNDFLIENFKKELKKISENLDEILAISPNYMDKEKAIIQFITLFLIFDKVKEERKKSKLFF